jgi:hypothetical protein
MIQFNFRITNPWGSEFLWRTFRHWSGRITQSKAWEFNLYRSNELVAVECAYTVRRDHAGFNLMVGLFGFSIEFYIYDIRHWDYKENCFY